MKPNLFLMTIGWLAILISAHPVARPYELAFSTYFGGSAAEGIRDAEVDALSNIYVAGTTRSADFPTTPGAYDEHVDTSRGATRWGYNSEIFVAKLSLMAPALSMAHTLATGVTIGSIPTISSWTAAAIAILRPACSAPCSPRRRAPFKRRTPEEKLIGAL